MSTPCVAEIDAVTLVRASEIGGTALVAAATTAGAMVEAEVSGVLAWLVPMGIAGLVGYFTSLITTRSELASLRTEIRGLKHEVRRYYQVRGVPRPDEDEED